MPRRKTTAKTEPDKPTYGDLEEALRGIRAGRDQLHEQIDQIMTIVIAHKDHAQDEAREWPQIQKALSEVVNLLEPLTGPAHQVYPRCWRTLVSIQDQAGKRRAPTSLPGRSTAAAKPRSSKKGKGTKK